MSEILVVHGYAGAGKSTNSERLSRNFLYNGVPIAHVSAGTRLRAIRNSLEASNYTDIVNHPDAPSPLPDEVVNGVIFESVNPNADGLTLIDGYPRHESGVEVFSRALEEGRHRLIGCVGFEIVQETSVARILSRGERRGELIKANSLLQFAIDRYRRDAVQTQAALNMLGTIAPVERVDANGEIDDVWNQFGCALGRLGVNLSLFQEKMG